MRYLSDLTDREWETIKHYFVRTDPRGSEERHDKRNIVNAILYVVKGGIQWRLMPKDFPPWQTVYDHYRNWSMRGIWEIILDFLNEKNRKNQGRNAKPSYGIIDSQSVKTLYASEERGFDGGKKKSKDVNVILLLIYWVIFFMSRFMLRIYMILKQV